MIVFTLIVSILKGINNKKNYFIISIFKHFMYYYSKFLKNEFQYISKLFILKE